MSIESVPDLHPGDAVETTYGVGVITKIYTEKYEVLLWRIPGKSIGSAASASLLKKNVLGKLPAAPGMITTDLRSNKKVIVECYKSFSKKFIVSSLVENESPEQEGTGQSEHRMLRIHEEINQVVPSDRVEVEPKDLKVARSGKFYPLMHELMKRADEAASSLSVTTSSLIAKTGLTEVVDKTSSAVQSSAQQALSKSKEGVQGIDVSGTVDNLAESVEKVVPSDEQIKSVIKMLKDEELTALLEKGKERLQQLVSSDIPQATKVALESKGIRLTTLNETSTGDDSTSLSNSLTKSREKALETVNELLQKAELDPNDLQGISDQLSENFTTMFDSLSQAAKSDRTLGSIFETISTKSTEWQQATGKLLSTRSASLFLEGASRIQARAVDIFSQGQLDWADNIGSKLTKAFTEGDAAVARLKSIELGDAVRNRLVDAIEVRSDSLGGLDGIIAGALTTIKQTGEHTGSEMQNMLVNLEMSASTAKRDSHETLISVLSRGSLFRDVSLLQLENVLCTLEKHLGDDLSPEDIAALASGEGGTAKIFEPIAKRAAEEIDKQLDAAEAAVTDKTVLEVLTRVRKIISGELTINAVMDEVVNVLNDEKVVAAGETLVKHGENVLDAIEGVSSNQVVNEVVQSMEKAGITKDVVMKGIENLDVNQILDTAEGAVTDEAKRNEIISSATDTALDFFLKILPSMPVPPFDGVKDGLVYHFSNLSMEGFKVKKENIMVEIAGMRATKTTSNTNSDEKANDSTSRENAPFCDETTIEIQVSEGVKATELLIIDITSVTANFFDAVWSFEQTYLPYLKGRGKADVVMSDGAIRLTFELRKQMKKASTNPTEGDMEREWEPVLCLHDRTCSIGEVNLKLQGEGKLTWIVNKLASVFKGPLRDYVVRTIIKVLTDRSGWILQKLNEILSPYWDLIMNTAHLNMDELVEADEKVVVAAKPKKDEHVVELVWRERLPLGLNLLLNDQSGLLKVVDLPRGSQARAVCEKRQMDPELFKGATIVGVNGCRYSEQDELFDALKDPGRPKTVLFELAESAEAERIKEFVDSEFGPPKDETADDNQNLERIFEPHTVRFNDPGQLGIEFGESSDKNGLIVVGFIEGEGRTVLAAERSGNIYPGDLLTHINGMSVIGENGSGRTKAIELLETVGNERPLTLTFVERYLCNVVFHKPENGFDCLGGPQELKMEEKQLPQNGGKRIVVRGFKDVSGSAEKDGVMIGDHLVFVNGSAVGAGCRWIDENSPPLLNEVYSMLRDDMSYPIGLTFARPIEGTGNRWSSWMAGSQEFKVDEAETICVRSERLENLGCVIDAKENNDIVVTDFLEVPGEFQDQMQDCKDDKGRVFLSVDSVNGQFVPSYATTDMVKNAIQRSWTSHGRVEVLFCDDERKEWVNSFGKNPLN